MAQRGRPLPPRDDPLEDAPFNAIIFDYRGVGVSEPSLDCHGIDDRFTEAITTPVLHRALGFDEVTLFGVSYGSRLAADRCQRRAEGVRGLILDAMGSVLLSADLFEQLPRALADATIFRLDPTLGFSEGHRLSVLCREECPFNDPTTTVCGRSLVRAFVADPDAPLDIDCIEQLSGPIWRD